MKRFKSLFVLMFSLFFPQIFSVEKGSDTSVSIQPHAIFPAIDNDNKMLAFGWFKNGFELEDSTTSCTFESLFLVGGEVCLNGGKLYLNSDIHFSSDSTITSSGKFNLNGYSIIFGNDIIIPDNIDLQITSSGIIDGQGHNLILGKFSQILLDGSVSVTFKNIVLKNNLNTINKPVIRCTDWYSQLILDNAILGFNDDFAFRNGQLFILDDVQVTGTSKFIYNSVRPSYIQPHSRLKFDPGTTFDYSPSCPNENLIILQDETSELYFDGSTLQTTHTGIQLTKGSLFFDNKVTITTYGEDQLLEFNSIIANHNYGNTVVFMDWSPDGKYLALGGQIPTNGKELQIFLFNGDSLVITTNYHYGILICSVDWSPDGKYLAVGGEIPANGKELQIFSFNGSSVFLIDSYNYGQYVQSVDWSPDGKYLAIGGGTPDNGKELQIFSFNGSSISLIDSYNYGDPAVYSGVFVVNWSPDGRYLAIGGYSPDNGNELQIFSFNGSSVFLIDSYNYGDPAAYSGVYTVNWSSDGKYLAIGGGAPDNGNEIQIFYFNGSSLNLVASQNYGDPAVYSAVNSVRWSSDGKYLAVGGYLPDDNNEIQVFLFNGSGLSLMTSQNYGSSINCTVNPVEWNPEGKLLSVGGATPSAGHYDIEVHNFNWTPDISPQSFSNSVVLGDSLFGSDNDLNTHILSAAQVKLDGKMLCDNSASAENNLDFAAMASSIIFENPTYSKLKIVNNEGIKGWEQQSIVDKSGNDNSWVSDNTVYGYDALETDPSTHLIFNNSNAIVQNDEDINNLQLQLNTIDHGPSNIHFDTTITLSFNIYLGDAIDYEHKLYIHGGSTVTVDGSGRYIHFARDSVNDLLIIDDNTTLILENIVLKDFLPQYVSLGTNSELIFGDGTTIEIGENFVMPSTGLSTLKFQGNVILNGYEHALQICPVSNALQVASGGNLILENARLDGLHDYNVRCLGPNAHITYKNDILVLCNDYTFSDGTITFSQDVTIKGKDHSFTYKSPELSKVSTNATLFIDRDVEFIYDAGNSDRNEASKTALILEDPSAILYLNGCTLHSTRTGLSLINGSVVFEDKVTLISDALYDAEALEFSKEVGGAVLGGAMVDMYGIIKIEQ